MNDRFRLIEEPPDLSLIVYTARFEIRPILPVVISLNCRSDRDMRQELGCVLRRGMSDAHRIIDSRLNGGAGLGLAVPEVET